MESVFIIDIELLLNDALTHCLLLFKSTTPYIISVILKRFQRSKNNRCYFKYSLRRQSFFLLVVYNDLFLILSHKDEEKRI